MRANVLAEQLTALAEIGGDTDSLVVETRYGLTLFRFGCDSNDSGRSLTWEASPAASEGGALSGSQMNWLRRAGFHEADGRMVRRAGMPYTIEAARLIADLTAFLLERGLGLSPDTPVWISRRTTDSRMRGPTAA